MKKLCAVALCLALCLSALPGAAAAEGRDLTFETRLAGQLQALGLFRGTGDGLELDRPPSRTEALVMLVRALGKGAQAEAHPKTHPFTDVPAWADGYVSYAWEQGLTQGTSASTFGGEEAATAETYLTLLLRALGYSSQWDFDWDHPWSLAAWCGILPPWVDRDDFLRADAVDVTAAALYAGLKGTDTPLHAKLAGDGAFTAEAFAAAFPTDPMANYRAMDRAVTEAVGQRVKLGQVGGSRYHCEKHILLDAEEREGGLFLSALASWSNVEIDEDNTLRSWGFNGSGIQLWLLELDPETLALRSARTEAELTEAGVPLESVFSAQTLADRDQMVWGIMEVTALDAQKQLNLGNLRYRPTTHDEALDLLQDIFGYYEFQRLETEDCTVILHGQGTPRGNVMTLMAVYKPGSALGDGTVVDLPLPDQWGSLYTTTEPDEFALSEAGKTLTYAYHFDEALELGDGATWSRVAHEAGTYRYTTDLTTGETALEIVPDQAGG